MVTFHTKSEWKWKNKHKLRAKIHTFFKMPSSQFWSHVSFSYCNWWKWRGWGWIPKWNFLQKNILMLPLLSNFYSIFQCWIINKNCKISENAAYYLKKKFYFLCSMKTKLIRLKFNKISFNKKEFEVKDHFIWNSKLNFKKIKLGLSCAKFRAQSMCGCEFWK